MRALILSAISLVFAIDSAVATEFAIINARIFTAVNSEIVENGSILIREGRFAAIGENIELPEDIEVIDAQNALVTPGLMNGATRLGLVEMGGASATNDAAVTTGALGADFDISYAVNKNSTSIALARADGITRAATIPSGTATPPFLGAPAIIRLDASDETIIKGVAAIAVQIGGESSSSAGGSRAAQWILLQKALREAQKFNPTDSEEDLPPLARVLSNDVPLVIDTHRESDIRNAIGMAKQYEIRMIIIGASEAWRAVDAIDDADVSFVLNPIINVPERFDSIGSRSDAAQLISQAGAPIAFKSYGIHESYNAGIGVREAAGTAVANGLAWAEAMRALTIYPAQMWGVDTKNGTLSHRVTERILLFGPAIRLNHRRRHCAYGSAVRSFL